jgi:toxin ParE1/3/4
MNILFDDDALLDLQRLHAFISKDNPRAADNVIARIFDKIEYLREPELTYMGRPGLDPGTHELVENPYIIVYEVHEERGEIVVLGVVHGAQKRKSSAR